MVKRNPVPVFESAKPNEQPKPAVPNALSEDPIQNGFTGRLTPVEFEMIYPAAHAASSLPSLSVS